MLNDELVLVGNRFYVKATATFTAKDGKTTTASAYAREADTRKGMDASQITGTASSYARKYALNGLFLIDDTKDADTNEYQQQGNQSYRQNNQQRNYQNYRQQNNRNGYNQPNYNNQRYNGGNQ